MHYTLKILQMYSTANLQKNVRGYDHIKTLVETQKTDGKLHFLRVEPENIIHHHNKKTPFAFAKGVLLNQVFGAKLHYFSESS